MTIDSNLLLLVGSSFILTVIELQLVIMVNRSDESARARASYPPRADANAFSRILNHI